MSAPPPFYLLGATGSGKSEIAVAVAERCDAEIIGADAFQVYRGLPLLTAQPAPELRARVPHHLIDEIPLTQSWDVAQWRSAAQERLGEIQRRGKCSLIVGGNGLYVRSLTHGLAELPQASAELRAELAAQALPELQARLLALDPACAQQVDLRNPRRVIRALEICLQTGRLFTETQREWQRPAGALHGVVLSRERAELYRRIDARTEAMFAAGVIAEVQSQSEIGPTARQTLGWSSIQAHLAGTTTRAECIAEIQQATRRYAKRQATWFRKEPAFRAANIDDERTLIAALVSEIQQLKAAAG